MKTAHIIGGSSGIALDAGKRLGERGVALTITGRDAANHPVVGIDWRLGIQHDSFRAWLST